MKGELKGGRNQEQTNKGKRIKEEVEGENGGLDGRRRGTEEGERREQKKTEKETKEVRENRQVIRKTMNNKGRIRIRTK